MKKVLIIAMIAFTLVSFAEPDSGAVVGSESDVAVEVSTKREKIRHHINRKVRFYQPNDE